jgi:hypothetical protein
MPFDPKDFEQAERFVDVNITEAVVETALGVFTRLINATTPGNPTRWENPKAAPAGYVGGAARGNWQIGIGSPPRNETGQIDPGGQSTISVGETTLDSYKLGPKIYLVNNRPYIKRLDTGHSTAIPKGFVRKSIQAGGEGIKRFKVKVVR